MKTVNSFQVAYVITSTGRDVHTDMALVSMLSVRISNPVLRIVVVCDEPSAQAIKAAKHRLLDVCDELISVSTPEGQPTFRNRWIKTQLINFVSGNVLHLDTDTLVRGSLAELPQMVSELGAVTNHNGATLTEQFWHEDRDFCCAMTWPVNFKNYLNGGVWFFKPCPRVNDFFAKWHELWLVGVTATGRWRDQPSLNTAIVTSRVDLTILPAAYNTQFDGSWRCDPAAVIWHFFASGTGDANAFTRLLDKSKDMSMQQLRVAVARVLKVSAPWANLGWAARRLATRVESRGRIRKAELLWLEGKRKEALRWVWDKIRARLTDYF